MTAEDGVTARLGVSVQSDTLQSPIHNQAGRIFKKNQLQRKRFVEFFLLHILLVSYHFAPTVDGGGSKQRHYGTTRGTFKGGFSLIKEIDSLFKKRPNHA